MDTLTHIVLGACIGEAIAGKQLGKKAMLLGALAQNIPDADIIASSWMSTSGDLLAHRGFSHSILFAVLASLLLAVLSKRWQKRSGLSFKTWWLFWGSQLFVHIFIDAFNAYGTGWFEPFSHYRVSFNAIFVVDPLFTIWPAIAFVALLIQNKKNVNRMRWVKFGLTLSCLYLICCLVNKSIINAAIRQGFQDRHIAYKRYFTTPAPLNSLLWYVVAENDSGYYTTYRSVLDKGIISFDYSYRNDRLLHTMKNSKELKQLIRFSEGYYTVAEDSGVLTFNDLRFGRIAGWKYHNAPFIFYYYLQRPADNGLVIQRGRFADFNKEGFISLLQRIKGN